MSAVHLPRSIRFVGVFLLALLMLGVRAPAGAHAAPHAARGPWAAIAYSLSADYWVTTSSYPSQDEAKGQALYLCRQKARGCSVMVSVQNGYAALAVSDDGRAAAGRHAATLREAKRLALAGCKQIGGVKCYIEVSVGSSD